MKYVALVACAAVAGVVAVAGTGHTTTQAARLTASKTTANAAARGPRGPRGPRGYRGYRGYTGAQGPQGPQGAPGVASLVTVESPHVFIPPGDTSYGTDPNSLRAFCPPGMYVVGTGFNTGLGNQDFALSFRSLVGGFVDNDVSITIEAYVQAICAQLPPGASISSNQRAKDLQAFRAAAVRAQARHKK